MHQFISMSVYSSFYKPALTFVFRYKAFKDRKERGKTFFFCKSKSAKKWCVQQIYFGTNENMNIFVNIDDEKVNMRIYL